MPGGRFLCFGCDEWPTPTVSVPVDGPLPARRALVPCGRCGDEFTAFPALLAHIASAHATRTLEVV